MSVFCPLEIRASSEFRVRGGLHSPWPGAAGGGGGGSWQSPGGEWALPGAPEAGGPRGPAPTSAV